LEFFTNQSRNILESTSTFRSIDGPILTSSFFYCTGTGKNKKCS
jgi:hypothetical protein